MVVYNIIKIMSEENDETYKNYYYDSIFSLLQPTNMKIQQWIRDKLTC